MTTWMEENEYESVRQMQGSMSMRSVGDPAAFERANYMKVLRSYTIRGQVGVLVTNGAVARAAREGGGQLDRHVSGV